MLQDLPPTTVEKLDLVSGIYPKHTTDGSDGFHPRVLKPLSKTIKKVLVDLLMATEKLETWVGVKNVLNAVLKETGGYRLLGLFTTRYTWWSRIRFLTVAEWEDKNSTKYFGMGKASPAPELCLNTFCKMRCLKQPATQGGRGPSGVSGKHTN